MYCLKLPKDMTGGRLVILAERQDKSIASVSGGVLQGGMSSMVCLYGFTPGIAVLYGLHRAHVANAVMDWLPARRSEPLSPHPKSSLSSPPPPSPALQLPVVPIENAVMDFRGDLNHFAEKCSSQFSTPRVSLVVEQYLVPAEHYYKVSRIWASARLKETV